VNIFNKIYILFKRINYWAGIIAGFLIFLICVLSFFEVISRAVFNNPTRWSLCISQYIFLYSIFLGSAYCFLKDGHIRVELILDKLSKHFRGMMLVFGYIITAFFLVILTWKGLDLFFRSYQSGWRTVTAVQVPTCWINIIIPIGSILMITALIVKSIEVLDKRKGEGERDSHV